MGVWEREIMALASMDEADRLRAYVYGVLAGFLARAPSDRLLRQAASFTGDDTPFGCALTALAQAASVATPAQADREYHRLFIGVVRGELVPYASYYRTGFLHQRPLADLRADMQALGIARAPEVAEPEDHIAALCEMMAGLILGHFGVPAPLETQRDFFDRHLAPWGERFFTDLEQAEAAGLFRPVGTVGRLFMGIEADAFTLADRPAARNDEK